MKRVILFCLLACCLNATSIKEKPGGMIKSEDLQRAQENLRHHEWARQYLESLKTRVGPWVQKISPEFLQVFIPDTTPGDTLFTPCPNCRDSGKPYLPHGDWSWTPERPEELTCKRCGTVFPNEKYPETVVVRTMWGKPQMFTFAGGEPLSILSYKEGRPSFSGNIRAQKVKWIATLARDLAEAYALTGQAEYARCTRDILLRFAEVYPYWLVHVSYGEYADMAPETAAEKINALPKDESVYPPNRPDRKLHTGYWTAGRAGASGLEGIFVRDVATAYDLTTDSACPDGQPVYSERDRERIEKDLLRESTKLLVADKAINNKSMANRAAVGLVGLTLGDPVLVRFGLEGFSRTVNEWFLPDGGTPESPAYAIMALSGIVDFAQAMRGYTDPVGYQDIQGKRYDNFDPYRDTPYRKIWEAMLLTLQGNLRYPPFADSYVQSGLWPQFAELMADNYPENASYLGLLYSILGDDWNKVYAPYAIYYADPNRESKTVPPLKLPSYSFQDLKLGFMRTGVDGRESLLLLSASDWGAHHHLDSLNLYYWKNNTELWSDFGYLWDHPDQEKTTRTLAHNTVLIDEKDQIAQSRHGKVRYFLDTEQVKAMRAASNAYPAAKTYERAVTLINHGDGHSYVVDVFWVEGGATQDYVYHGPSSIWELENSSPLESVSAKIDTGFWSHIKALFGQPSEPGISRGPAALAKTDQESIYDLTNVQEVTNTDRAIYGIRWKLPDAQEFSVWHLPVDSEKVFVGQGWGQRDSKNTDRGKTLPYVVRRTEGSGRKIFISVLEEYPTGQSFIRNMALLRAEDTASPVAALQIETSEGRDYVVVNAEPGKAIISTPDGSLETNASLAVVSVKEGSVRFYAVDSGKVRLGAQR